MREKRFRVIEGGETSRPYHGRGGPEQIVCRTCEADIGVATSEFIATRLAPMIDRKGEVTEGTPSLICAHCLARGKVTRLV